MNDKTMSEKEQEAYRLKLLLELKALETSGIKVDGRDVAAAGIGATLGAGIMWLIGNM